MRANPYFQNQDKSFWAHVRSLSEAVGYTVRGQGTTKAATFQEILKAMTRLSLKSDHLVLPDGSPSFNAQLLLDYFAYRAQVLDGTVRFLLQTEEEAAALYARLSSTLTSRHAPKMNKQKGEKYNVAYLTASVNLLIEAYAQGIHYDHDPGQLTTITRKGMPVRTLARRVDGAFPSVINPVALWEIKEYYYTTTFGSRVAGGVYETLLDGMELEEMREATGIDVQHVLIIDAHYTWWECGRSYLCRMIDMLNMGYADEILFGREIETRIPALVQEWINLLPPGGYGDIDDPHPHGSAELI